MSKSLASGLAVIYIALLIAPIARSERILTHDRRTKTLTVYYEDITGGPLINLVPVAGPSGQPITLTTFGAVYVTNAPARQGISRSSPKIGSANGIAVGTFRDGSGQMYLSLSLVFNSGGTMEFQGIQGNEFSLVGGTKEYRGVKGFASLETVQEDPALNSSIVKSVIVYKQD